MGRLRKGELKPGETRKCDFCNKDVYLPPSKLSNKMAFCSRNHYIRFTKWMSFSIPCAVCRRDVYVSRTQVLYRARSTCSPACRRALRKKQAEERRTLFGYTKHQIDRNARYSVEADEWRVAVFARDDYTCQMCGVRGGYLEADHIKPWAFFPDLRFELSNGRTLCRPCHDSTKESYKIMRMKYAKDTTEEKK